MLKKPLIFLLIIIAIACFLRLWQLDLTPPGLYPDEAMNANDALDSIQNKDFKFFYPENNGREGIFIWIIALSFTVFGPSIWSLKLVSAIFGILTVLGVYLLTKEILSQPIKNGPLPFDIQKKLRKKDKGFNFAQCIALLSSFFLAVSFWHINFSRIGFRAIMVPFCLVFGFYFLLKGFRKWKLFDFILAGFFWGLGFHTYISFRMSVLILGLFLVLKFIEYIKETKPKYSWKWLWNKMYIKGQWWKVDLFILTIFLVGLPLGIYFLQNPADFTGRAAGVSIFNIQNPIYGLGKSIIVHLQMFNFYGDGNWRHNFSGSSQLLWIVGIFFLIGLFLFIKSIIISLKNKNHPLFIIHSLLLSWFLVMLLPGFLSAEGIPHALRVIGVIPVAYIFSGIGAYWLFIKIKPLYKGKKQLIILYLLISILLLTIVYAQFNKYFFQWAKTPELKGAFSQNYVKIGDYLNSLPDNINKYVIVNQSGVEVPYPDGVPVPAQTSIFIERTINNQPRATYLKPEDINKIRPEKDTLIVPLQYDDNLFLNIFISFPEGNFKKVNEDIWIYEIK